MKNIPNILTIGRFLTIPVIILLMLNHKYLGVLLVFTVGSLTDKLDGYIARKYHFETPLGAYLDPLADKFLIVSSVITLLYLELIPFWFSIIIILRDIIILLGIGILTIFSFKVKIAPSLSGKISTFMQMSTIIALIFVKQFFPNHEVLNNVIYILYILTILSTIISFSQYFYRGVYILKDRRL